jgi:hypothetical protein
MSCPTRTPVSLIASIYRQPQADKGASRLHTRRVEATSMLLVAQQRPILHGSRHSCMHLSRTQPHCDISGTSAPADLHVSLVSVLPGLANYEEVIKLCAKCDAFSKNKQKCSARLLVNLG